MIIIPARLASTRFKDKILVPINGLPMFIKTANQVKNLDEILIATDTKEVLQIAQNHGFKAVLTSTNHTSGTERINEAAEILGLNETEIIINVQADEPFIEPEIIQSLINLSKNAFKDSQVLMTSCYKIISKTDVNDPNLVKVVMDKEQNALYFSRSKIPYERDECGEFYGHIGLYGYTRASLRTYCNLLPTTLENVEKLEQLRALYHGYKIKMQKVKTNSFGIDTKEDLEKALQILRAKK